jgi:hypothetical protein
VGANEVRIVSEEQAHPLLPPQSKVEQTPGQAVCRLIQLAVGYFRFIKVYDCFIGITLGAAAQK